MPSRPPRTPRSSPSARALEAQICGASIPPYSPEFLASAGPQGAGPPTTVCAGFELLGLPSRFLTQARLGPRVYHPQGLEPPQAAAAIHPVLREGFIKAEVLCCEYFREAGGERKPAKSSRWESKARTRPATATVMQLQLQRLAPPCTPLALPARTLTRGEA